MKPDEAVSIIGQIVKGEVALLRAAHLHERLERRQYTMQDVWKLLRTGGLDGSPRASRKHGNYKVRLIGRCLDGRETRLVLGLWRTGPCTVISIVDVRGKGRKR